MRGANRTGVVAPLLAEEDHRLLMHGTRGHAVCKADRVVILGAVDETSATGLLRSALAQSDRFWAGRAPGVTHDVWPTRTDGIMSGANAALARLTLPPGTSSRPRIERTEHQS